MNKHIIFGAILALTATTSASAAIVYSNNFDAENSGLSAANYNGFAGLSVTDGTVDLVRSGDFGITCPGGTGSCVDLDGSTNDAGVLRSGSYAFKVGQKVSLNFQITGNQRGGAPDNIDIFFLFDRPTNGQTGFSASSVNGGVPIFFNPFVGRERRSLAGTNFAFDRPLDDLTFFFIPATAGNLLFGFQSELVGAPPAGDGVGLILDNLSLDIGGVPEPASWAMLITGFGLTGTTLRRRRMQAVAA